MLKKIIALSIFVLFVSTQLAFCMERNVSKMRNINRETICKNNFEELFLTEWNPNVGNDPEMMAILQKYIFGDVFSIGNLDNKTREMVTVTSLVIQQALPQLKAHVNALLNVGASPIEVREVIYQCAPYIGFPKTLNAIECMNVVFKERNINLPLENATTADETKRFAKGYEIQNPIYGDEIENLFKDLPANVGKDVSRLLTEVCFGDFYSRKGLDLKTRELLAIAALTTNGDIDILRSHIIGNLKIGNSPETITTVIVQCMPYIGFPKTFSALKVLKSVLDTTEMQQPFKLGEINPYSRYFTGKTYLNMLVEKDSNWNSSIGNVTFDKGARTNWHKHSGGQILLVTAGEGRYQEKGKEIQVLKMGDVVKIPSNVIHWHGASPNSSFAHISIETNIPNNVTTWLESVEDKDYK